MYQERLAAAVQGTRTLAGERRELVASHLERTVDGLTRLSAELAGGGAPAVAPELDLAGLWVLNLDGSVKQVVVDPGNEVDRGGAPDVAAGRNAWTALA